MTTLEAKESAPPSFLPQLGGVPSIAPVAASAGLVASALLSIAEEGLSWITPALALICFAALVWTYGRRRWTILCVVAVDMLLILAYAWSLGSSIHVVIRGSPAGYTADVGGNVFSIRPHPALREPVTGGGRIGLFAGPASKYIVEANGETSAPGPAPLTWLAGVTRFAVPRPAWRHVRLRIDGQTRSLGTDSIHTTSGSWTTNPRGETEGSLGATGWLANLPARTFSFSADLMRADGWQGVLLGVGPKGFGYLLAIRLDHRDARFYYWNRGVIGACTCVRPTAFSVQLVPMVQRALQLALPSIILALLICLIGLGVYSVQLPFPLRHLHHWTMLPVRWLGRLLRRPMTLDAAAMVIAAGGTASAALIALNLNQALPTIEDTSTYIFQAKTMALGRLWAPVPRNMSLRDFESFFRLPFTVVSHGQWFGKYPPGWPLLLSIGALFDKAWMVTPVVGGLSLLLVYLIGRQLYGRYVGILAAVLALGSPFVLAMSGSLLAQSATWLFLGAFVALVLVWVRRLPATPRISLGVPRRDAAYLIGAGLALGGAVTTRQLDAVALAIPFIVLFLRRPLGLVWMAAGGAVPATLFFLYNQALTGNAFGNGYVQAAQWDRLGFGAGVGGPTSYEANFTLARAFWNLAYDLEHLQSSLFGWPFFFALALIALPFVIGRANRWDWLLVSSSATLVAAYMTYWASGVTGGLPRYWYTLVPWLALLCARGFQELCRLPPRIFPAGRRNRAAALVFPALLLAVLMVFDVADYLPLNLLNYRNGEGVAVATVQAAHVHHAIIFQRQRNRQDSDFDVVFSLNSPLLDGNTLWALDRGRSDTRIMRAFPGRSYYLLDREVLTRLRRTP